MTSTENEFVLSHVFKNVSSMKEGERLLSPVEEHSGVPWKISVKRMAGDLALYLYCEPERKNKEWSVESWFEIRLSTMHGKPCSKASDTTFTSVEEDTNWGFSFIKWEDMMNDYVIDDALRVEVHVKIKRITGINTMNFDESNQEFSDVVLVVENQKFYVSKLFLARHSPYFKTLLIGSFEESGKSEVALQNINANDFQKFLQLLYGEYLIEESTVDGIVHLADMYDAKLAIRKCEQFLVESSEKSLKEKLQLAHRYDLKILKNSCLSEITTAADIRSVLISDLSKMDPFVVGALMQKSLALSEE